MYIPSIHKVPTYVIDQPTLAGTLSAALVAGALSAALVSAPQSWLHTLLEATRSVQAEVQAAIIMVDSLSILCGIFVESFPPSSSPGQEARVITGICLPNLFRMHQVQCQSMYSAPPREVNNFICLC